jgi:RNA polymerase sigma factor (sigma-70 family)
MVSLSGDAEGRETLQLVDPGGDAFEAMVSRDALERRAKLTDLTASLSPSDRLLLELLYVQKLGADEIAATLRIQKGAVYTRKTRLIKRLRSLAQSAGLVDT